VASLHVFVSNLLAGLTLLLKIRTGYGFNSRPGAISRYSII
jgi:hypothetical protein